MPRRGLDRAAVVAAAADLADEVGLAGLTLAGVAARLGVRSPSLFNHVPGGLDGLRRELALLGLRELTARLGRAAVGKAGGEAVRAVADAFRAFGRARPGVYAATLRAVAADDPELQQAGRELVELALAVLAAYRLPPEDALHAVRGLRAIVHGFVGLEAAGGFGLPLDLDTSFHRLVDAFISALERAAPPAGQTG
jgi:AcrR family transcriptional regulator